MKHRSSWATELGSDNAVIYGRALRVSSVRRQIMVASEGPTVIIDVSDGFYPSVWDRAEQALRDASAGTLIVLCRRFPAPSTRAALLAWARRREINPSLARCVCIVNETACEPLPVSKAWTEAFPRRLEVNP
ncbi:MAG: hypothetical protein AAF654_13690 [Myxococcota bacterium]